jgi:hypothetical protein
MRPGRPAGPYPADSYPGGRAGSGYAGPGYPDNAYPDAGYADAGYPDHGYPDGGYRDGPHPEERHAAGPYPEGQYADGQYAEGPYAERQYADGQYPASSYPEERYAEGGYPDAGYPRTSYPDGYPEARYPDAGYPDAAQSSGGYRQQFHAEGTPYPPAGYQDGAPGPDDGGSAPGPYAPGTGPPVGYRDGTRYDGADGAHQGRAYAEGVYRERARPGAYPDESYSGGAYTSDAHANGARPNGPGYPGGPRLAPDGLAPDGRRPAGPARPYGPDGYPPSSPGPRGPEERAAARPVLRGQALSAEPAPAPSDDRHRQPAGTTPRSGSAASGPGLDQPVKPGAALALRKEPEPGPRPATPEEQLEEFARDLRELRGQASLGYPEMAELSHYTMRTLASAAGGLNLPTLPVTMAYVRACHGSVPEWEDRWHRLADAMKPAADGSGPDDGGDGRREDGQDAAPDQAGPNHQAGSDASNGRPADGGDHYDLWSGRDDGVREGQPREERPGPARPRPSQVSTPQPAQPGVPAQEQEPLPPPPPSDQVYVITSAAPRRPNP